MNCLWTVFLGTRQCVAVSYLHIRAYIFKTEVIFLLFFLVHFILQDHIFGTQIDVDMIGLQIY